MPEKNNDDSSNAADPPEILDVLRPVIQVLAETNGDAADILIEMAKDGRIETHQTRGTLIAIAEELLATTKDPGA